MNKYTLRKIIIFPFLLPIHLYRYLISPILGQNCRYTPTCSQYAITAIKTHGVIVGLYLASRRVLRCHPWGDHGYDPVPEKPSKKLKS